IGASRGPPWGPSARRATGAGTTRLRDRTLRDAHGQIAVSADRRDPAVEPREQADGGGGGPGGGGPPGVGAGLEHPKPPRNEEDAGAGRDAEADRFQQALELSWRERFLHSVAVEPDEVQHMDHERPEERVELVRHADDRDPAGPEDAEDLARGLLILLE